jgi:hypothetical protein
MPLLRPQFRVIQGGRAREITLGFTRVVVNERPVFRPDGVLLEENTLLAMSFFGAPGHTPARGGSVVVREGRPVELLLVVNDAEKPGGARPGWLESAWEEALRTADRLHLAQLTAPLIGCSGGATLEESLGAAAHVIAMNRYANVRALELVCGDLAELVYLTLSRHAHLIRH